MSGGAPMLEVALDTRLGGFHLAVDFRAEGGVTALYGRSGAGKSSIVQAVAGLFRPDRGRIVAGDTVLFDSAAGVNLRPADRRLGVVFQDGRLFPHMTVQQNLRYGGQADEAAVIDLLGLAPLLSRRPRDLSGGERQRVAIGRALMAAPRVLLMDEPLSSLDPPRRAEILPWLERLRDRKVPILYVSHAMAEVARLADTLVIVDQGRVVLAGPLADVLADPGVLPLIGGAESGAVLTGRIGAHDAADDLTEVLLTAGRMLLPGRLGPPGASIRLRIPAQDIVLSLTRPAGISALNLLECRVVAVGTPDTSAPGIAVQLALGPDRLLARVTRRSAATMALAPGLPVWVMIKATAMAGG
jgi:molybdate transport system ATP-binding protein